MRADQAVRSLNRPSLKPSSKHMAWALGVSTRHLQRLTAGDVPVPQPVALADHGLLEAWRTQSVDLRAAAGRWCPAAPETAVMCLGSADERVRLTAANISRARFRHPRSNRFWMPRAF
jgi:hypothetical protein